MEVYVGRQPILDRGWNIAGYELLFRSSHANFRDSTGDVSATSQVISNAILGFGLDRLLGDKPAFVNFDRTLLLGDWTTVLPPEKVVIEILERVEPDRQVLDACETLRERGYALAFHPSGDNERAAEFAPFVDIMRVDFQKTTPADQESLVRRYQSHSIRMIAGKVETEDEFVRASQLGYHYFQGFFFASPVVLQTSRVPASKTGGLRLVKLIQHDDMDFDSVEEVIRFDIAFSHSLLTYVNSAAFQWPNRIESVRQGLLLLGADGVRKWAWMASLSSLGENRPPVLMAQVLMRGRFCEAISGLMTLAAGDADPFVIGMFSLLDAILQRPLEGVLDEMNIGPHIRLALLGPPDLENPLSLVLKIVKAYELGDFEQVHAAARIIGLSPDELSSGYLQCLSWVETVFSPDEKRWRAAQPSGLVGFHRDQAACSRETALIV
jgi:c-di-GMP-related signal transduction protein